MRKIAATLFLIFALHGLMFGKEPAKPVSVATTRQWNFAEFEKEIQRLEAAAADLKAHPEGAVPLHQTIPDKYIVVENNRSFTIDNTVLKKSIGEFTIAFPQRKADLLNAVQSAIAQMREGLYSYAQPSNHGAERNALAAVLARREFRSVSGPGKLETWAEQVKLWLARQLVKLFGKIPTPEHGSQLLTWILIGIATVLLSLFLMRISRRVDRELTTERVLFAPSDKHWSTWLSGARAAAASGNWRDAIHLAYWAGISRLEESGAWVPDRARTPREYLKIMAPRDPNRSALSALTKKFEIVWYGDRPAAANDYEETLRQLEALGCR